MQNLLCNKTRTRGYLSINTCMNLNLNEFCNLNYQMIWENSKGTFSK